jgi:2-amino-4-hydroxy-6-hydroxymethyldihydropteridine diphosphokinase
MLAYVALGSNMGDGLNNCRQALEAISSDRRNRVVRYSPFYCTEPVGKKDQGWFVNGVAAVETSLPPRELLEFLLSIEKEMGRIRRERWGPRVIDLDILIYGEERIDQEGLQVPHPRLQERRFVLIPLRDIAPDLKHPILGKTISQILSELKTDEKVQLLAEEIGKPCTD